LAHRWLSDLVRSFTQLRITLCITHAVTQYSLSICA
jgi:hypothetical protein